MRPRKKSESKEPNKPITPVPPVNEPPKEVPKQEELRDNLVAGVPISDHQREVIKRDLDMLALRTKEFLTTFLIIGYNLDDLPVQIVYGKTQKDLDALNLALSRFIMLNTFRGSQPLDPEAPQDPHHDPH